MEDETVFRIGLSNLPLEPPDNPGALLTEQSHDPSALYSPADFAPLAMQQIVEPQIVPARFRYRQSDRTQFGPYQTPGQPPPAIPVPEAWKTLGTMLRLLPHMPPMAPSRRRGDRKNKYHRCIEAANGDADAWEEFCDSVGPEQNNVVGGQPAELACRRKTFESSIAKTNWCENQYGNHNGDKIPSIGTRIAIS